MLINLIRAALNWLAENLPASCQRCKRMVREKNIKIASSVLGVTVRLCPECHRELYHPWGEPDD